MADTEVLSRETINSLNYQNRKGFSLSDGCEMCSGPLSDGHYIEESNGNYCSWNCRDLHSMKPAKRLLEIVRRTFKGERVTGSRGGTEIIERLK
jgi:hypothetical protein